MDKKHTHKNINNLQHKAAAESSEAPAAALQHKMLEPAVITNGKTLLTHLHLVLCRVMVTLCLCFLIINVLRFS